MEIVSSLPDKVTEDTEINGLIYKGASRISGNETVDISLPRGMWMLLPTQWGGWGDFCTCYFCFSNEPHIVVVIPIRVSPYMDVTGKILDDGGAKRGIITVKNKVEAGFILHKYQFRT